MQTEAYVQGQLVRGSLLNVVRHVINSLNILSVKLCVFHSILSELLYLGQRKNEHLFFCLPSSKCLPYSHQLSFVFPLSLFAFFGCYWCLQRGNVQCR